MKKLQIISVALFCAISLMSCNKEEVDPWAGSYTYKTSGTVELVPVNYTELDEETLEKYHELGINTDPQPYILDAEQGQMHIIKDGDNKYLVTFDDLFGNVSTAVATVSGDALTIGDGATKIVRATRSTLITANGEVAYKGTGRTLEETLIFEMQYNGNLNALGVDMLMTDSAVTCVARKNK